MVNRLFNFFLAVVFAVIALTLSACGPDPCFGRECASSCDIKDYRTVVIGDQTWMAENLNCNVSGSKCYGNDPANCTTYGTLYDQKTAMDICPQGWHLPSYKDWEQLIDYVENDKGCTDCAGKYLKAKSGWDSNGNGEDTYGFSALLGGKCSYVTGCNYVGYSGNWWCDYEYFQLTQYTDDTRHRYDTGIQDFLSVRCVKDYSNSSQQQEQQSSSSEWISPPLSSNSIPPSSSSNIVPSSSSSTPSRPGVGCTVADNTSTQYCSDGIMKQYGFVTDEGQIYKTVEIGTQIWMAENLNYNTYGSKCYDNSEANCVTYGRLYDWATAKTVCPSGWHLPSDAEWTVLAKFAGGTGNNGDSGPAGTKLKAASGWNYHATYSNGTDDYGFSALPGGYGGSDGYFLDVGGRGYWWSASELGSYYARGRDMYYSNENVYWGDYYKLLLRSVRCVQD